MASLIGLKTGNHLDYHAVGKLNIIAKSVKTKVFSVGGCELARLYTSAQGMEPLFPPSPTNTRFPPPFCHFEIVFNCLERKDKKRIKGSGVFTLV
jgi:hypothetical protein